MVVDKASRDFVKAASRSSAVENPARSPSGSEGSAHSLPVIWKVSRQRPKFGRFTLFERKEKRQESSFTCADLSSKVFVDSPA